MNNKYLWALDKERYGLLEIEKDRYLVYDLANKSIVIIEDDVEGEITIKEMIKNGNKKVTIENLNQSSL
ncbi:hypothetical protein [Acetivibrio clariflavus]|uniref:Uncharacterized protein n=1 Tax=Acetivibrio clariflavus (strain DSM 19732 / NBRC 101661 / EBR45) TaxID=720554 RepID=G8LZX6_ACECE|nr:hypothetical protein [Acetivibrio clariflavus]AEV69066.1 hypothetical protein Clocl_2493 [Acetivibrio clariflavus DSM 19732]